MIPAAKSAEALNALIDVLKDFEPQRRHLGPLHSRRIQGLVDKVPEGSLEKPIARIMQACFLRDFETADIELNKAINISWPATIYEANIANGLLESFQFESFLTFLTAKVKARHDDPDFLYFACHRLNSHGMHITAWEICHQLEKLNAPLPDNWDFIKYRATQYQKLGIEDLDVAAFLTNVLAPAREALSINPRLVHALSHEVFDSSYPYTFAFILHLDAQVDTLLELSDSIADHLSECKIDANVDEHFAYSVWGYSEERRKYAS